MKDRLQEPEVLRGSAMSSRPSDWLLVDLRQHQRGTQEPGLEQDPGPWAQRQEKGTLSPLRSVARKPVTLRFDEALVSTLRCNLPTPFGPFSFGGGSGPLNPLEISRRCSACGGRDGR
jgi:hypothetical protein